jgi:hypothetical protein
MNHPQPLSLPQSQPPFAFVAEFRSASATAIPLPLPLPSVDWNYSDDDADYDDDVCMTDAWVTDDDGSDDGNNNNDDDDNDISSNATTDPADIEIVDRPTTTMESAPPFLGSCWVVLPDLREVRRSCRLILKKSG